MVADPELHPASQGPLQVRRLAVPVVQAAAAAAEVAVGGDDRGDAARCVSSVWITSITLTISP